MTRRLSPRQRAELLLRASILLTEAASVIGPLPGRLRFRLLRCARALQRLRQSGALNGC